MELRNDCAILVPERAAGLRQHADDAISELQSVLTSLERVAPDGNDIKGRVQRHLRRAVRKSNDQSPCGSESTM